MINKFAFINLRNSEYFQYMVSFREVLGKHDVVHDSFGCLYDALSDSLTLAEAALAVERGNEKVREKNDADRYRDRLHSKLFNFLKSIIYDDRDPRFDDAQAVMRIVNETGNPTRLPENAQSAVMTTLGNRLEPMRARLEAIGAQSIVDDMMDANRQFIRIESELREILTAQKLDVAPASMSAVRKQIDPLYRSIVAAINGYMNIPSKADTCRELVVETNVLVARYEALLAARKRERQEKQPKTEACEVCG